MGIEIFEEDDFCAKCNGTENVGRWNEIPICKTCFDDEPSFKIWFENEMREFLDASPNYVKLPDGKYQFVGKSEV